MIFDDPRKEGRTSTNQIVERRVTASVSTIGGWQSLSIPTYYGNKNQAARAKSASAGSTPEPLDMRQTHIFTASASATMP